MTDQYTGTMIDDLVSIVDPTTHRLGLAQWQAAKHAKQRPTQFGDNKNLPTVKVRQYEPSPEAEDDMERDRR